MYIIFIWAYRGCALCGILARCFTAGKWLWRHDRQALGFEHRASQAHLPRAPGLGADSVLVARRKPLGLVRDGQSGAGLVRVHGQVPEHPERALASGDMPVLATATRQRGPFFPKVSQRLQGCIPALVGRRRRLLSAGVDFTHVARDAGQMVWRTLRFGWDHLLCGAGPSHQGLELQGWRSAQRAEGPWSLDQHIGIEHRLRAALRAVQPRGPQVFGPRTEARSGQGTLRGAPQGLW
mmetsp:Transcript_78083/g.135439  ORF Transcript_78083/g.135439 Transcript_78083/m.135439 type:complete len:237 (+) Transcript_78083:453-1163(+)